MVFGGSQWDYIPCLQIFCAKVKSHSNSHNKNDGHSHTLPSIKRSTSLSEKISTILVPIILTTLLHKLFIAKLIRKKRIIAKTSVGHHSIATTIVSAQFSL